MFGISPTPSGNSYSIKAYQELELAIAQSTKRSTRSPARDMRAIPCRNPGPEARKGQRSILAKHHGQGSESEQTSRDVVGAALEDGVYVDIYARTCPVRGWFVEEEVCETQDGCY